MGSPVPPISMDASPSLLFLSLHISRFTQTVEESFHVSKACVEPATSSGVTTLFVETNGGEEFILCNLSHPNLSENLDLNFAEGDEITFR